MQQYSSISTSNARQYVASQIELATSPGCVSIEGTELHVSHLTASTFHHTLIPIKLPAVSFVFRVDLLKTFFPLAVRISLSASCCLPDNSTKICNFTMKYSQHKARCNLLRHSSLCPLPFRHLISKYRPPNKQKTVHQYYIYYIFWIKQLLFCCIFSCLVCIVVVVLCVLL